MLISCNNSIFLFSVSSYWFDVPRSLYRVLVICPLSRSSYGTFVHSVLLLRCFTLIRLLIARVHYADNQLLIRHYAVFTLCDGIPLRTISPTSPRGVDCSVLFVCLLLFRRLTNNGPITVIGDTVLRIRYSPPFATCTMIQFSILVSLETVRKFQTGCLTCSPFE